MAIPLGERARGSDVCVFDIETENTGHRIMEDNKRIISVQTANANEVELFYADSTDSRHDLAGAKSKFDKLLSAECVFAGFNIKRFDIPVLAQFLDVKLPESRTLDLVSLGGVVDMGRSGIYGLEGVCSALNIPISHKRLMNVKTEECKARPEIVTKARLAAPQIVKEKGGTIEYAFGEALKKIAGGTAIYDSYNEFVAGGCRSDSLFYQYAIGDVVSEQQLLEAMQR